MIKIIDYELTHQISCLFEKKIFVYGTGVYGNKVAELFLQMEIEIEGFCETNPKKNEFFGKKILSAKTIINNYDKDDVLVIIASEKYYKEMINELQASKNINICTYYALFIALYLNHETEEKIEPLKNNINFFKKISIDMVIRNLLGWGIKWYCDILSQPSLVWIYQPGKVGSASIYWSNPLKSFHLHSLAYALNADADMSDVCRKIIAEIKKHPVKIITGVREPISRDLSLFFQGSDADIWPLVHYGNSWIYLFGDYSKKSKLDSQTLKERICTFEKSLDYSFEHLGKEITKNKADEFSWFDYEIKALLDVDIYNYPFDKEKGYSIIEQDNIQVLVYKCEKLNQLENFIGEFLNKPDFSLKNANQGEEKVYSYMYKRFKEEVKLNKEYFDYYYADNPKLKHFYTDSEIEQFKQKWMKKLQ